MQSIYKFIQYIKCIFRQELTVGISDYNCVVF